jgi:hypothetical protein
MAGGGYSLMHPGLTKYHHVGFVVPLLAALSPMFLSRMLKDVHQVYRALVFGVIVAAASYVLMSHGWFKEDHHAVNKAVLLGLLVAELTIFSSSEKIPSIVLILFFLFMYFLGMAEIH